jgi:glycosyltransferase involved in cell wall biosynthesis
LKIGLEVSAISGPKKTGIGHYVAGWLEALLEHDGAHEYILYSHRRLEGTKQEFRSTSSMPHFARSRWIWMQTLLPLMIRENKPALCHFTNGLTPLWVGRPFVVTIHDVSMFLDSSYHPRSRTISWRVMLPMAAHRAAAIITVSESSRRDVIRVLHLPPSKVHVVYGAPSPGFGRVDDGDALARLKRKYRLPDEFLLYVGAIEPRKNLRRLVRAMARIRAIGHRWQLVIVGPGGWLMEDFQNEIASMNLTKAIHCCGYVPAEDLAGLYSLATLFIYPSLYEGFGMPAVEAMACGVPVVTSNRGSLREVCADGAYLVDPRDEQSIARGIMTLLENDALRSEQAARGLARARRFSWAKSAERTLDVYTNVLG